MLLTSLDKSNEERCQDPRVSRVETRASENFWGGLCMHDCIALQYTTQHSITRHSPHTGGMAYVGARAAYVLLSKIVTSHWWDVQT